MDGGRARLRERLAAGTTAVVAGALANASPTIIATLLVSAALALVGLTFPFAALQLFLMVRPLLDNLKVGVHVGPVEVAASAAAGTALIGLVVVWLSFGRALAADRVLLRWMLAMLGVEIIFGARAVQLNGGYLLGPVLREIVRFTAMIALYVVAAALLRPADDRRRIRAVIIVAAVAPALGALSGVYWGFVNQGSLANFLAVVAVLGLPYVATQWHPIGAGVLLGILAVIAVLGKLTGVGILVIGTATYLCLTRRRASTWALVALGVLALGAFWNTELAVPLQLRFDRLIHAPFAETLELGRQFGPEGGDSFVWRLLNWIALLRAAREYPVLGHGLASTPILNPFSGRAFGEGYAAHSDYVQWLFEGGVAGVVCFVTFMAAVIVRVRHYWRRMPSGLERDHVLAVLCTLIGLAAASFTDGIFGASALQSACWVAIAAAGNAVGLVRPLVPVGVVGSEAALAPARTGGP